MKCSIEPKKLIGALRCVASVEGRCVVCDYNSECVGPGCYLLLQAADQLEFLSGLAAEQHGPSNTEKQAFFRLGQMDAKERLFELLQEGADNTHGVISATLRIAAGTVRDLEVRDEKSS